ncbi:E3 SUMO-protein ligase ZBED1-like [Microplitis mediator]|uniref:E3 SUMO-protein ligase ZBED1-like n=1 Tax=Microplitis mediator TaxID=375433 RepID=UPI0025579D84|nr:E3 SUMO-protein ligase ZBED1-like [Microplitis mediator]XP_057334987.1 E3 SUMO-protein ligase ZBED1-like [Microplitis mediator]XP_057342137.1 E3 SUMO-protein ligase ZBED1-like [Microplitis mediator]
MGSLIWRHFIKTSDGGMCKYCKKYLKSKNTTTNLHNHLMSIHKIEVMRRTKKSKDQPPENNLNSHLNNHCDDANKDPVIDIENKETTDNNNNDHLKVTNQKPAAIKTTQLQITQVIKDVKSYQDGTGKAEQITNAILYMIIKDCMPFRTVEKGGFLNFMKLLSPLYKVPGRDSISRMVDHKYDQISSAVKCRFLNVNVVSITCDVWTETTNTQSFLGVTAHYIYNDALTSSIIGVTDLNESHTAEYLGTVLKNICEQWNLPTIAAVVSDNASNITGAIQLKFSSSKHLPCLAHTVNLVVTKAIQSTENLDLLLENVKDIVSYFKRSVNAADELKKITGDNFNEPSRLIQSVATRWNSTFYMLDRFLLLRKDVTNVLISQTSKTPNVIIGNDIAILQEITELLRPFEGVTRDVSGAKYETCGKIIPTVYNLFEDLEALSCKSDVAKNLKNNLKCELKKRFDKIEFNAIPAIAMLLDPRFKKMYFQSSLAASKAISHVNDKLQSLKKSDEQRVVNNENEILKLRGIWKHHEKRAAESMKFVEENNIGHHFELKQYLKEPPILINEDPIQYWNSRKSFFPSLYKIAEEYLIIPATSVPSERLFSTAGLIMTKRRNRIKPDKFQKILFLQCLDDKDW